MTSVAAPHPHPSASQAASLRNLPVNLFGSVMGLAGLALAWRHAGADHRFAATVGNGIGWLAIATLLAVGAAYLAKAATHADAVKAEYMHPVSGNFFGTISISLLLASAVLEPTSAAVSHGAWLLGTVVTAALSLAVVSRLLRGKMDASHAVPALLIPGVASLDIAVTGASMPFAWARDLNLFALGVGAMLALVLFTLIMSRLVHRDPLPAGMTPSLMILIAPFEVGFLAYTNFTARVDDFAAILYFAGLFLFVVLAPKVFRRDVPFSPAWWAISFPIAALVNAALRYATFTGAPHMRAIAWALLVFLTLALAILLVRTLRSLGNGQLLKA